jgi:hypothetical protein
MASIARINHEKPSVLDPPLIRKENFDLLQKKFLSLPHIVQLTN